ncbi:MAG TPA: tRNA (adenosine(37)-N6)-dimethylallyltransferase MiaA [candidate division WOR-3 bacterium]|uniref:tRNA dimethylallyltransferase n=1 Tax=candidate division WOR-3 bacterium TaxID=2052148 RepID=A0A7V0T554_UNCW3|nr:tRNA (adenosine(37)-N6)-dimethylallyltransferase MiaA [candidate division WOR-3 bacterium]
MKVAVLTGPTGVGKTEIAVRLAERFGLELVSADSRQVYCWLDIGTDKPSREMRDRVRFHMVDKVEPDRDYSAADFARDALAVMRRLRDEGRRLMVVGGSGMYIRAIFEPFFDAPRADARLRRELEQLPVAELHARLSRVDPERAAALHVNDRQRVARALEVHHATGRTMSALMREAGTAPPDFEPAYFVLTMNRDALRRRIDERFDRMMQAGLLDEVRMLREHRFSRDSGVADAYGYSELLDHLDGKLALSAAVEKAKARSRAYAKRQLTWCRRLAGACWVEYTDADAVVREIAPFFESQA